MSVLSLAWKVQIETGTAQSSGFITSKE